MKRTLKSIAMQLSEDDIQELIRFRKVGGKKVIALQKKRAKLAADLEKIDAQLARMTGEAEAPKRGRRPGKAKPGRPAKAKTEKAAKTPGKKAVGRPKKSRRVNLSAAVREVFSRAGTPLKAKDVVDALPEVGIKVANVADMRKRISVVLASQKNSFEQVERGVYQLKG